MRLLLFTRSNIRDPTLESASPKDGDSNLVGLNCQNSYCALPRVRDKFDVAGAVSKKKRLETYEYNIYSQPLFSLPFSTLIYCFFI